MVTTVVVAPRERFSSIVASLASLFATIPPATPVVVVEGCSPQPIRRALDALRRQRPFTWIALDHFVTPQEARNIGFDRVATEHVAFADNDMIYEPAWLERLEANARTNRADLVAPLICIGPPRATTIHHAGGELIVEGTVERPHVVERHRHQDEPVAALTAAEALLRNEIVEFHCFLARSAFIREIGPLDERLITREQIDVGLRAALKGARVTFEPGAIVTYDARVPFRRDDLIYHLFRWSEPLARRSLDAFRATWGIDTDATRVLQGWIAGHRLRAIASAFPEESRALGAERFRTELAAPLEARLIADAMATRASLGPGRCPSPPDPPARRAFFASRLPGSGTSGASVTILSPTRANRPLVVAGMATMPSRRDTFVQALSSVLPQVDRLFLFLDRFETLPTIRHPAVVPLTSQAFGDLRANGKLLGLLMCSPGDLYLTVDDDILYPPDFVERLREGLASGGDRMVVGVHGSVLKPGLTSYWRDRQLAERTSERRMPRRVDVLGTDGAMFSTACLHFDVRSWEHRNMVDLCFALECARRGLDRIILPRPAGWIGELAVQQPDSISRALQSDDSIQTRLARSLLALHTKPATSAAGRVIG